MARYISIWRRQRICRENGQGRVYAEYMEKAEYMQREWRRQIICRVYGEGRVYAENDGGR